MARLPEEFIEEVRARNDIVDVISQYVHLQKKGNRYWGLCPFHGEKTGSFSVRPDNQFFYCFGCHAGGNVFQFIQKIDRVDFLQAVEKLAERANMEIPEATDGGGRRGPNRREQRERLLQAGKLAAQHYHAQLMAPVGREALDYLTGRGLDLRMIRRFGLGFAPEGWHGLKDALLRAGVAEQTLLEAGLMQNKEGRTYDTFRNRVMFPILAEQGGVLGFGGRVMDGSLPKYLNSTDTPIFNKRKNLYGMHVLSKQRGLARIILCEGYMDVLAMHQAGFSNAAASLGTALTEEQARLIHRYVDEVVLAYDGDGAGQAASLRGMEILQHAGLEVRVAVMPDGLDPDDVVRKRGREAMQEVLDRALPLPEYHMQRIRGEYDLSQPYERAQYANRCCQEVLSKLDSDVERSVYIQRLHLDTGISEVDIRSQTERALRQEGEGATAYRAGKIRDTKAENPQSAQERPGKNQHKALQEAERRVLVTLMNHPDWGGTLTQEDFSLPLHRELLEWIRARRQQLGDRLQPAQWADGASPDVAALIAELLMTQEDAAPELLQDCLKTMRHERIDSRIRELNQLLSSAPPETRTAYKQEINRLLMERRTFT